MVIPKLALAIGTGGLVGLFGLLFVLARGYIYRGRTRIYLHTNPIEFLAYVGFLALLTAIFLGAAIFIWLHPNFHIMPTASDTDD